VQPVGTDCTISIELVKHRESHLYKNVTHVRSQREKHVKRLSSSSCELTFITTNPEPYKFPQSFLATTNVSFRHFWYSRVELDQKNQGVMMQGLGVDFVKTTSLGSLR
jgi:regulatory protein YycH of two-component signal transduction system YycFG